MKIRTLWTELFHADRPTDMTKLIVFFCNFAKVPKKFFNFTPGSVQSHHQALKRFTLLLVGSYIVYLKTLEVS